MIPVILAQIKTRDGITLDGIYIKPRRKSKIALIWIHGLASQFYSGTSRIQEFSKLCHQNGVGFFVFNTRGHDIVTKEPRGFIGAAFEKFKSCVLDIKAMVAFSQLLGYKRIVLVGHSTGANKAVYFMHKTKDRRVAGLILVAPANDIVSETKRIGKTNFKKAVRIAQRLKKRDSSTLIPQQYGIYSAHRYMSLHMSGGAEDTFPYYNPAARWKELKSIKQPLLIIYGSHEEHIDRSAKELIEIFRKNAVKAKSFTGVTIKGANHSFTGKEKELARTITDWVAKI